MSRLLSKPGFLSYCHFPFYLGSLIMVMPLMKECPTEAQKQSSQRSFIQQRNKEYLRYFHSVGKSCPKKSHFTMGESSYYLLLCNWTLIPPKIMKYLILGNFTFLVKYRYLNFRAKMRHFKVFSNTVQCTQNTGNFFSLFGNFFPLPGLFKVKFFF